MASFGSAHSALRGSDTLSVPPSPTAVQAALEWERIIMADAEGWSTLAMSGGASAGVPPCPAAPTRASTTASPPHGHGPAPATGGALDQQPAGHAGAPAPHVRADAAPAAQVRQPSPPTPRPSASSSSSSSPQPPPPEHAAPREQARPAVVFPPMLHAFGSVPHHAADHVPLPYKPQQQAPPCSERCSERCTYECAMAMVMVPAACPSAPNRVWRDGFGELVQPVLRLWAMSACRECTVAGVAAPKHGATWDEHQAECDRILLERVAADASRPCFATKGMVSWIPWHAVRDELSPVIAGLRTHAVWTRRTPAGSVGDAAGADATGGPPAGYRIAGPGAAGRKRPRELPRVAEVAPGVAAHAYTVLPTAQGRAVPGCVVDGCDQEAALTMCSIHGGDYALHWQATCQRCHLRKRRADVERSGAHMHGQPLPVAGLHEDSGWIGGCPRCQTNPHLSVGYIKSMVVQYAQSDDMCLSFEQPSDQ